MYKATVKKDLPGTLSIPSIGARAYKPGDPVFIPADAYWKQDVQAAIKRGSLILVGGAPKAMKLKTLTNVSAVSLILPIYGVIRAGTSKDVKIDDLKLPDIDRLLTEGKLIEGTPKTKKVKVEQIEQIEDDDDLIIMDEPKPKDESKLAPVDQKMSAHVHKPKSDLMETPKKNSGKKKGVRAKHLTENDLLIDLENGVEPGEKDGIQFVDIEQNEARVQQHPGLRNLKGK